MPRTADTDHLWRLTMKHSPVGMALVSPEGRWLAVNDALCRMLGYDAEAMVSMTFQDITHPEDLAGDLSRLAEMLAGERSSYRITKRYLRADGTVVWGDLSVTLVRDDADEPMHLIAQILDVTSQLENEARLLALTQELDEQRRLADAVFEAVDIGLVLHGRDGHYRKVNRQHREFQALAFPDGHRGETGQTGFVYTEDQSRTLTREELPSYRSSAGEEFDDLVLWAGEDPVTRRALSVSSRMVRDSGGRLIGAALAYQDVTALVRALAVKDEFVTLVSHELRTPLASVLGHLEILGERDDLPRGVPRQVEVMERNSLRLRRLVNDMLLVAQDSSGGLMLRRAETDLVALASAAIDATAAQAAAAGVSVTLDAPERLVADVDEARVRQMLDNLLRNAVTYCERDDEVRVVLEREGHGGLDVRLRVVDTGLGVAADEVEDLFSPFYRGREAQLRQIPGTGLGLAIVRQIVDAHRGEVSVETVEQQGSTFTVLLPEVASD